MTEITASAARSPSRATRPTAWQAEAIVKAALDGLGSLDILVNNAGITRDNLLMRMDAEEVDAVIDTNLGGPFWMTVRRRVGR